MSPAAAAQMRAPRRSRWLLDNRRVFRGTVAAVIILSLITVSAAVNTAFRGGSKQTPDSTGPSGNYAVSSLPVNGLTSNAPLEVGQADRLAINGQLLVNQGLVLTPATAPKAPVAGQVYFDKSTNQPYYYNGTQFVGLKPTAIPQHVTSLGGASGVIGLGNGLTVSGNQLAVSATLLQAVANAGTGNTGPAVSSLQGLTGDVTLSAGSGIAVNGTTITNTGVVSLTSGSSVLGLTRDASGNYTITSSAAASLTSGSSNLVISKDANNNYTITDTSASSGTAVLLGQASAQLDSSNNSSININKTGTGSLLELASNGIDKFVVDSTGRITTGTIDYAQINGAPTTIVNTIGGTSGTIALGTGLTIAGNVLSAQVGVVSIAGTANQITATDDGSGNYTLTLPQDINTSSSPTFAGATLNGALSVSGAAALTSTLSVTGASTLTGGLNVGSTSQFQVSGTGNLTTSGTATFNNNVVVGGASSLTVGTGTVKIGSLGAAGIVQADATGTLTAGALNLGTTTYISGALPIANGGTGATSYNTDGVLYSDGSGSLQSTVAGVAGQVLLANALGVPTFTAITGDASVTSAGAVTVNKLKNTSVTLTSLTSGQVLQYNGTDIVNGLITNSNLQSGTFNNITGTGTLTTGAIDTGFGTINTANNITTSATVQGAAVTSSGALQGNTLSINAGAFAVDNTGAITAVSGIASSGAYSQTGGNFTITGTGSFSTGTGTVSLNGNTSVTTGNGFTVVDGSTSLGGTLDVANGATFASGVTVTGGNVSLGVSGVGGVNGSLTFSNTANSNQLILTGLGQTVGTGTAQIPDLKGTTDTICFVTLGNCAGTGTGVTATGSNANYLPVFSAGQQLTDSIVYQNGTSGIGINTTTVGANALAVNGTANITGATVLGNSLSVANGLTITAGGLSTTSISASGGYVQSGTSANTFTGQTTFSGVVSLSAAGTALNVTNNASVGGTLTAGTLSVGTGGISTTGTLSVSGAGASSFAGDLSVLSGKLTLGQTGIDGQLIFTNSTNSNLASLAIGAPTGTGNATYTVPSIAGGTSDTICLLGANNCGNANSVSTATDGTQYYVPRFTAAHTIENSAISDNGTTVTVNGETLAAGTISTSTIQGSGNVSLTAAGNLSLGTSTSLLSVQGTAASTIAVTSGTFTTTVGFTAPTAANSITFPDASGTVCLIGQDCGFATTGSGVTFVNGQAGSVTINNASGSGGNVTIDDASTTQKGIAQFNATNFTASSGVINTIQDIALNSSVQFGSLTLGNGGDVVLSSTGTVKTDKITTTSGGTITIDAGTGNVTFTNASGANSFVFPTSGGLNQTICTSGITCASGGGQALILEPSSVQTASQNKTAIFVNKAAGTGNILQLQAGGTDQLVIDASGAATFSNSVTIASLTVNGTATVNTITPNAALTVGATSQAFTLQGTNASKISVTNGTGTTTVGFSGTPANAVNYNFDTSVAAGTYTICTTVGNCAGSGGGITGSGTAGQIAKFTNTGVIANSIISESTGVISVAGDLNVGSGTSGQLTLGVASSSTGKLVFANNAGSNTIAFVQNNVPGGNVDLNLPTTSGTLVSSATGPLSIDPITGQISCSGCLTGGTGGSGGVTGITGSTTGSTAISGNLTINNALTSGTTITIDDASTTQKGIAQFNSTNFSVTGGTVNTIQNIDTAANVQFATASLTGANALSLGTTGTSTGAIRFYGSTAASGILTLQGPANPSANTLTLPNETGTICTDAAAGACSTVYAPYSGSSNYAPTSPSGAYVQLSPASAQTGYINVSGAVTAGSLVSTSLDTATAATLSLGTTNANAITIGKTGVTTTVSGAITVAQLGTFNGGVTVSNSNFSQTGAGSTFSTGAGSVSLNGNTTVANGKNLTITNGNVTQSYSTTTSGSAQNLNVTNGNSTVTATTVNGQNINLTGTAGGANTINGQNFASVTPIGGNTFNGLYFGTGYDNILNYNGTTVINGLGQLNLAQVTGQLANANLVNSGQLTVSPGTGLTGGGTVALGGSTTINLGNTTVSAGSYGSASSVGTFTVDAQGRLTAANSVSIAINASQITAGTLGVARGGTGLSSYTVGDLLYADTASSLATLADVNAGQCLISGGIGAAPAWGSCTGTSGVTGSGTAGKIAYFTSTGSTIGDSILSQAGTTLTVAGNQVVNAASGFTGNLLDVQVNSASKLSINEVGNLTTSGSVSAVGVNANGGSFQGTGGISVSGGATFTGTTNINTTGTSNTSIGNGTGTFSLNSNTLDISSLGALSGVTGYTQGSGNFDMSSSTGTFATGTGAVSLNGNTTIATGMGLTITSGSFLQSFSSNVNNAVAQTLNVTNTNATTTATTVSGQSINLTGTAGGTNTINGIDLSATALSGNTFYGINFNTGFDSLLSLNGASIINGSGVLQDASLSGTYAGQLTFSNASNSFTGNGAGLTSLNGSQITTGTVGVGVGGTGNTSYTTNGVLYFDGTKFSSTAASTGAQCLITTGAGVAPTWGSCTNGTSSGVSSVDSLTGDVLIQGTTDQVTVTDDSVNNKVILSLPQSINTTSNVQFNGLKLGGLASANGGVVTTDAAGNLTVTTGANSILVTDASGVPSLSTTLPNAVQDNITRVSTAGLTVGSIGSGFGTINIGSDITTTTTLTGATVNATSAIQLGGTSINVGGTLSNVAYLDQANTFSALSNTFSNAVNIQGTGGLSLGTSAVAGTIFLNDGAARGVSINVLTQTVGNGIAQLPDLKGTTDTICLVGLNNCVGAGASSIGTLDGKTKVADGATISNQTLYLQTADNLNPGLVSTGTQTFAGDKTFQDGATFNGTVTVAASQSIDFVGGATGTRPASPTAGQLYFDTTTNQLIQYNGSKWVSDRSTSTKIVAASNSTQAEKDAADYIATGTGDQTTINAALTAAAGGTVYLMEGTYTINGSILVPDNTTLMGAGVNTLITIPNSFNTSIDMIKEANTSSPKNISIKNLHVDGNKANQTSGSDNGIYIGEFAQVVGGTIENITASNVNSSGVYIAWAQNYTIRNATITGNAYGLFINAGSNIAASGIVATGNTSTGITLSADYTTLTNSVSASNSGPGINIYGDYVTVTGNVIQSNTDYGLDTIGNYGSITGNNFISNSYPGVEINSSAANNIVIGNNFNGNGIQLSFAGANNTISNNKLYGGTIYVTATPYVTVSGNHIDSPGSSTDTWGVEIENSSTNATVVNNIINDDQCTTACYAIDISYNSTATYLSGNQFSYTGAGSKALSINDQGTGTIYANQQDGNGNIINRNQGGLSVGKLSATATLDVQGGIKNAQLTTPAQPTLATGGTAGTTSYSYVVTALDGTGETLPSTAGTIATGNATLSGTNYVTVSWTQVGGAVQYKIYRTASGGTPATTGLIGTVNGNVFSLKDTGLAASGSVPLANTTGGASIAGLIQGGSLAISGNATVGGTLGVTGNATFTGATGVTIGNGSTLGQLNLGDGSSSNLATIKLAGAISGSSQSYVLPTTGGTFCLSTGNCSGVNGYIVNQNASAQTTANFWISGSGRADTSLLSPALDVATAGTLSIGTTTANALSIAKSGVTTTFNGNVTIAAGQYLTLTGSGTRPSSPTEGMLYYDTTAKRLLVYSNGKWQADRSTATKIVGTSAAGGTSGAVASQNADGADYVNTSTTSAQTVINSALSAVGTAGGGTVYLMEGTYVIDGSITLPSNVTLTGAGRGTVVKLKNGVNANIDMFKNSNTTTGNVNVTLSNLVVDGNRVNNSGGTTWGLHLYKIGSGLTSSQWGIRVKGVAMQNFDAAGNVTIGSDYTNVMNSVSITDSYFDGFMDLESTSSSKDITISNSEFKGSAASLYAYQPQYLNIVNNIFDTTSGISLYDTKYANISNNQLLNTQDTAIYMQYGGQMETTISNNLISGGITTAIYMDAGGTTISNNRIINNGTTSSDSAIYTSSAASNVSVIDNTINNSVASGAYAIEIYNSSNIYLSGNAFSGPGALGVSDAGTGTIYNNQQGPNGSLIISSLSGLSVGKTTAPAATLDVLGSIKNGQLSAPAQPTLTRVGTAGTTSYSYVVTALDGTGETLPSTVATATTGNATLSGTNYLKINWTQVSGAVQYKIYRTASGGTPATTGLIGTVAGNVFTFSDTGIAASGSVPVANTTGGASIAGLIQGGSLSVSGNATVSGKVGIGNTAPGYQLDVTGDINTSTTYRVNGTAGSSLTCTGGQFLQNPTITGGIVTGGACAAASGGVSTLQAAYTASTGGTTPEIKLDSTRGGLDIQDADTSIAGNVLTVRASAAGALGTALFNINSTGQALFQNSSDSTSGFNVKVAGGGNLLTVDTVNSRVGINLQSNNTPTLAGNGLEINGALRLSGGGATSLTDSFTTPRSASVNTKINIPLYNPGSAGQILAFGLPNGSATDSRAISVFDDRAAADNQPAIGVFSPNEGYIFGFSWDGSNTVAKLKTSSSATNNAVTPGIAIQSGNATGTGTTSGSITIDSGSATATAGSISLGATNASSILLGRSGITTTINGSLKLGNYTTCGVLGTDATGALTCSAASAGGVTTVGVFSASSQTNGANITGNTITFGPADTTNPGMVTASGTQTFGGAKTFNGAVTAAGGLTVSANQNLSLASGTGTFSQTYSSGTGSSAQTLNVTNNNTTATGATINGENIQLVGTANANSNANTLNGINFANVTAQSNNTFNALYFGTGYNNLLNYNGNVLISGAGMLQNVALDSTVTYTNLQKVGSLTATGTLTTQTATATDDQLVLSVTTGGAGRFAGTITNKDLTAARTYTLQDNTGIIPLGTAANSLFFTTTGATNVTLPTSGTLTVNPASGSYLQQVPTTTAANTITPTTASVTALTVNGTSGTAATAVSIVQGGAALGLNVTSSSTGDGQNINLTNTAGTQTNGLAITRNGTGGTTTNLLNLTNTAGTVTNAINLSGTYTQLINSTNFKVSNAGAVTAVGVNSGTGLIQGTGGLTLTGTTSINATGSGVTTIGSAAAGAITVQSGAATNITGGAASTISTTAGGLTLQGFGGVSVLTPASASAATSGITIQTGNSSGTTTNSGSITIDSGTATGTTGTINIGTANASAVSIGKSGTTTTVNGNLTTAGNATVQGSGGLTLGTTANAGKITFQDGTVNNRSINLITPALTGSYNLTLPTTAPSTGQCLQTDSVTATQLKFAACATGTASTLQDAYNNTTSEPELTLNSTRKGLTIRDAATTVGGNLFELQNNAGTVNYLSASTTGIAVQNANGNAMVFDSTTNTFKIFENVASPTNYASISYSGGKAIFAASSGTTQIGSGSGNVTGNLTGASDIYNFAKTYTPSAAYSLADFTIQRALTGGTNALTGSVLKVEDASTGSAASPDVLYVNQNNTSATGNLIVAKTGGSTTKFSVTTAGNGTFAGSLTVTGLASCTSLQTTGAGLLQCGSGGTSYITAIGAVDGAGTANNNGMTVSGSTLYLNSADATHPGVVSAGAQTFGGAKTFKTNSTSALQVQNTSGTTTLNVDTTNQNVSIRTKTDTATYGSDVIPTHDFTNASWVSSNWTKTTTSATHIAGSKDQLYILVTLTPGVQYKLTYTVSGTTDQTSYVTANVYSSGLLNNAQAYGNGTKTIVTPPATSSSGQIGFDGESNWTGTITNVSLVPINTVSSVLQVLDASGTVSLEVHAAPSTLDSTFVGVNSGTVSDSGTSNSGFGNSALASVGSGSQNSAFGAFALQNTTTGSQNTAVGIQALQDNTTGYQNTAVGTLAMAFNTDGYYNTAIGYESAYLNSSGYKNAAIGLQSLYYNTTGYFNTALGAQSLLSNTTGFNNTGVGYRAGYQDSAGNFKTLENLQNSTVIGAFAQVQASNSIVLGSVDTLTKVGIGTTIPLNQFSVSPLDTQAGTAGTGGVASTTVTGVGTSWTANMVGEQMIFADGQTATITAVASTTSLTLNASVTEAAGSYYRIHKIGLQVTNAGKVGVGTASPSAYVHVVNDANGGSTPAVILQNGSAGTGNADLLQFRSSTGEVMANFNQYGDLFTQAANIQQQNNTATALLVSSISGIGSSAVLATFQGSTGGQTGDLIQIKTGATSAVVAKFTGTGDLILSGQTASATAFVVQQAGSTNTLFTVNTLNNSLTVGSATNGVVFTASTLEPILNGTARHQKTIVMAPEFTSSVLDAAADSTCSAANNGTMTSGLTTTGFGSKYENLYNWTSTQATAQCYDIVVQVLVPSDYAAWNGSSYVDVYSDNLTNATGALDLRDTANAQVGTAYGTSLTPSTVSTWQQKAIPNGTGTYTAGQTMTLRIRMSALSSANFKVGNITLNYYSKY